MESRADGFKRTWAVWSQISIVTSLNLGSSCLSNSVEAMMVVAFHDRPWNINELICVNC